MESIVPVRNILSDRFPVASFAVRVPEERYFEVACATDPRLFHPDWRQQRTQANFFTTRGQGLHRAPRGETMWMIPPDQLRRFAGSPRVYYALGSYGAVDGRDPHFTIAPDQLQAVPSVLLAPDFTGRTLDRSRIGVPPADANYGGGAAPDITWGGDLALAQEHAQHRVEAQGYDDGYDPNLWRGGEDAPAEEEWSAGQEVEDPAGATDELVLGAAWDEDEPQAESYGLEDDPAGATDEIAPVSASSWEDDPAGATDEIAPAGASSWEDDPAGATDEIAPASGSAYDDEPTDDDLPGSSGQRWGSPWGDPEPRVVGPEDEGPVGESASDEQEDEPGAWGGEGRFSAYEDEDSPPHAVAHMVVPLDIPEKVRLLRRVGRNESGAEGYAAINADTEFNTPGHSAYQRYHIGLSWGLIQFTQRSGNLGKVLRAMKSRSDSLRSAGRLAGAPSFEELFGPASEQLLAVTNAGDAEARVAPVEGQPLWAEPWVGRFRRAGRVAPPPEAAAWVQAAQHEVGVREFVDPIVPVARWLDLLSPRGVALLLDRVIHMGRTGGLRWVLAQISTLDEAGAGAALRALGHADLRAFQQATPGLRADGQWGPMTHAALLGALRERGQTQVVPLLSRPDMLSRIDRGAHSTGFQRRVHDLYTDSSFDDHASYVVG